MRTKVFAVIDTNVVISALYSDRGAPAQIMEYIGSGNVIPLFDERMLDEYYRVMHYDKYKDRITESEITDNLYAIIAAGIYVNDVEKTKAVFTDKDDIPFFEVKESSEEFDSVLVTGNIKHFPEDDTYIVTPATLLAVMGQMERFIKDDKAYEADIEKIMQSNLDTPKYSSGEELLEIIISKDKVDSSDFEKRLKVAVNSLKKA